MTEAGDGVALADYERPEGRLLPTPGPKIKEKIIKK